MSNFLQAFEIIQNEVETIATSKIRISVAENILREQIIKWRAENGYTQTTLAERLEISKMYLSDIENGKRNFSDRVLKKLREVVVSPSSNIPK